MVTAGWVRRETDSQDARVARVYLTEKAAAAIPELSASIERTNDELMRNFSLEEKLLMKRFLRDFRE